PLRNPALVSVPLAFLLGYVATVLSPKDAADEARYAEMEVRALTGAGAERSTSQAMPQATPQLRPPQARPVLKPAVSDPPELPEIPSQRGANRRPVVIAAGVLTGVLILAVSISVNRVLAAAPSEAAKPAGSQPSTAAEVGPE